MTIAERIAAIRQPEPVEPREPQSRVITVRMPRAMHERIRSVAHEQKLSMNLLCVLAIEQAASELEQPESERTVA